MNGDGSDNDEKLVGGDQVTHDDDTRQRQQSNMARHTNQTTLPSYYYALYPIH